MNEDKIIRGADGEYDTATILQKVYEAIKERGYDPAMQFAGYILSEDPTYIPDYNNARGLIRHLDRDELLKLFIESYFEKSND